MEEFKLELDHNEENSVFYEIHPAVSGETIGCLDGHSDAKTYTQVPHISCHVPVLIRSDCADSSPYKPIYKLSDLCCRCVI